MASEIGNALRSLEARADYAIVGKNARIILTRAYGHEGLSLPLDIIGHTEEEYLNERKCPVVMLSDGTIIDNASSQIVPCEGNQYTVRVAQMEHLVALELAEKAGEAVNAFFLIQESHVDLERVRCMLKRQPNYSELYQIITEAHYELSGQQ
jgi:hypothetical protein